MCLAKVTLALALTVALRDTGHSRRGGQGAWGGGQHHRFYGGVRPFP